MSRRGEIDVTLVLVVGLLAVAGLMCLLGVLAAVVAGSRMGSRVSVLESGLKGVVVGRPYHGTGYIVRFDKGPEADPRYVEATFRWNELRVLQEPER